MKRWVVPVLGLVVLTGVALFLISGASAPVEIPFLKGHKPTEQGRGKGIKGQPEFTWAVYVLDGDDKDVEPWKREMQKVGWQYQASGMGSYSLVFERRHDGVNDQAMMFRDSIIKDFWWLPAKGAMGWGGGAHDGKIALVFITYDSPSLFQRLFGWLGL